MNKQTEKTILITGITGQLGQFLVNYINNNFPNKFKIVGTRRHKSKQEDKFYIDTDTVEFEMMDLTDSCSIESVIIKHQPDYFINTAANAFVGDSWKVPAQHITTNTLGVLYQLEAIKNHSPATRYFNLGSSEEFGEVSYCPQDEKHPFNPLSPYAASKCAAHNLVRVYRKSYGLYAVQGIQFNFESELRGEMYVTRKITKAVAKIYNDRLKNNPITPLEIGNLDSKRDWQYCGDVCDAIWRMLNQETYNTNISKLIEECDTTGKLLLPREHNPAWTKIVVKNLKEYVVSSGQTHSVREFIEKAFSCIGWEIAWEGRGSEEVGKDFSGKVLVKINPNFYRPADVQLLHGDSTAIKTDLNWKPNCNFDNLVKRMVEWDMKEIRGDKLILS